MSGDGLVSIAWSASRRGRLLADALPWQRADDWFGRHGARAVFLGRLVPTVRTLISVPAGINGMPLLSFRAWSVLGTGIWTALLAGAGYLLQSQYELVADYFNAVSTVVVALIVAWYLYRVATFQDGH